MANGKTTGLFLRMTAKGGNCRRLDFLHVLWARVGGVRSRWRDEAEEFWLWVGGGGGV